MAKPNMVSTTNQRTVKSGREMANALQSIYEYFELEALAVVREGIIQVHADLQLFTPKDTGWAAKHWSIGLNRSSESVVIQMDNLETMKPGDRVHVFNNVPYIIPLDEGHSTQRPAGFTHLALDKTKAYFQDKFLKLSKQEFK